MIEIDFSYINLPREKVDEWATLPSGRIVAMAGGDSYWFEPDGTSPKGSYLVGGIADKLAPARGIAYGLLLSVPIWCCITVVVYLCVS